MDVMRACWRAGRDGMQATRSGSRGAGTRSQAEADAAVASDESTVQRQGGAGQRNRRRKQLMSEAGRPGIVSLPDLAR